MKKQKQKLSKSYKQQQRIQTVLKLGFLEYCLVFLGKLKVLVTQACLTLFDPMDCSPPGSSVLEFSRQEY